VLRAHAFRKLDLSEYDIIISSASAEAKAVRKRPDAMHICYCHTPTRYYWSHYKDYLKDPGFGALNPLIRLIIPPFVRWMRKLDLRAVQGVDYFIANSHAVAARIKKYYKRDAAVINPAIDMQPFRKVKVNGPRQGFVMLGRQVAYKRYDLGVQACTELNTPLTVIGNGPEHDKLLAMAGQSVRFRQADDRQKVQALAEAEAFLFPQEEDFGMVQIEAMAAGTPVIAYKKGGALDAVVAGKTGLFFDAQTVASLKGAIKKFRKQKFNHAAIRKHTQVFDEAHFIQALRDFVLRHHK